MTDGCFYLLAYPYLHHLSWRFLREDVRSMGLRYTNGVEQAAFVLSFYMLWPPCIPSQECLPIGHSLVRPRLVQNGAYVCILEHRHPRVWRPSTASEHGHLASGYRVRSSYGSSYVHSKRQSRDLHLVICYAIVCRSLYRSLFFHHQKLDATEGNVFNLPITCFSVWVQFCGTWIPFGEWFLTLCSVLWLIVTDV